MALGGVLAPSVFGRARMAAPLIVTPAQPSGGTFGNNHGLTPSGTPDVGLTHASGNVHPRPDIGLTHASGNVHPHPPQTPTPTPGTSTHGSIVGGSDSGSTIYVPSPAVVNTTIVAPSSMPAMTMPGDAFDEFGLMAPASGLLAQFEAMSTPKKVAVAGAVVGGLYLLFGRKR
jgi:hypothetical protein